MHGNIINNKKIDKDLVNEYIKDIRENIMKFSTMTNEILDISQVDINNIKVYNDKYNLKIIIKELIQIYIFSMKIIYMKKI